MWFTCQWPATLTDNRINVRYFKYIANGESVTVLALKKDVFSTLLSGGISQYLLVAGKQRLRIISIWVTEGEGK